MDERIVSKIRELVSEGVRSVKEVERHIKIYTKNEIFRDKAKPALENRRFYPKRRDIRNHMYLATVKLRFSKIDQVNLEQKVKEWQKERPCDHFLFRGYGEVVQDPVPSSAPEEDHDSVDDDEVKVDGVTSKQKLLFVHQTAWQKKLLAKYGNNICLLDATYRTTRYALPLFFVVVKTNVDYQVVASFAIQDETTSSIMEALSVIQSWNSTWKPNLFMTDNCEEEIQAIEAIFPGDYFIDFFCRVSQ